MPSSTSDLTSSSLEVMTSWSIKVKRYRPRNDQDDTIQLLTAFYAYLPPDGRRNLVDDVWNCGSDDELYHLAESLDMGLLRPIFANGGHTPELGSPSDSAGEEESEDEDEDDDDDENTTFHTVDPDFRNDLARLRENCLQRDNNRCVISGCYDLSTNQDSDQSSDQDVDLVLDQGLDGPRRAPSGPLETVHILPSVLGDLKDERKRKSDVWANLYRYFPVLKTLTDFSPADINREDNAMTMLSPLHREFKEFRFAVQVADSHHYRVKTFSRFPTAYNQLLPADRLLTLPNHDQRYLSPNPVLLSVHASIGNILDATSRGKRISRIMEEAQNGWSCRQCMAEDGSTNIEELLSVTSLALLASGAHHRSQPSDHASGRKRKLAFNDNVGIQMKK